MAGLDAPFRYLPGDKPVVEALLAAARRRARVLRLRAYRSHLDDGIAAVSVDGNTYALDVYLERLRRDLPTIAEAVPSRRTPAARRRVGLGFVEILTRYRGGMYDRYDETWLPTLRARTQPAYSLPHLLFAADEHLQPRLLATSDVLASWHFDEVDPAVVLEEMHTAAELMLKALVKRRAKEMSFAQLTEAALQARLFSPYGGDRRWRQEHQHEPLLPHELARRDLLLSLKDTRKRVRHDGADLARAWLEDHFWDAAGLLELLAGRVSARRTD